MVHFSSLHSSTLNSQGLFTEPTQIQNENKKQTQGQKSNSKKSKIN
jgi:hypothetical protein